MFDYPIKEDGASCYAFRWFVACVIICLRKMELLVVAMLSLNVACIRLPDRGRGI